MPLIFGRSRGFLLSEQTAHEAVDALAAVARNLTGHAYGAGVSLIDQGRCTSVGATDPEVLEVDTLQYALGDGPCLSAWFTNSIVRVTDTHADPRWRPWAEAAAAIGVRSCLSVPLQKGGTAIGAMKLYAHTPQAFTRNDELLLLGLTKSAAALLGHIQTTDTPQRISDAVKISLGTRDAISVARGILMERYDLDGRAALERLIALSRETGTSIAVLAAELYSRPDRQHPDGHAVQDRHDEDRRRGASS
ncbi:GAF and ANTAR domain-containing protein [Arthrobacter sp. B0490]|uniref:GAF and ANTAR domain-containing protein n=1 Tax=Arthrobacter sp. B0490 TaxID=2058891 RepID=UPI0015E2A455|nr:GAF and ANTAR domain-containing protein [Arthrobacter sp. B0490]